MKCWNKDKYVRTFGKYYNGSQINFLLQNWHSIDCLEIVFKDGKKELRIYEIKTKNEYEKKLYFKPKITASTIEIYNKARSLGFSVYFAEILLKENWNYETNLSKFKEKNFVVDRPKLYDKK